MHGDRCHIDFWNVVNADRRRLRRRWATLAEKIGEAAAIEHVIRCKRDNLAGRSIDPDLRSHLDGVTFDPGLKLLIAIMCKPDRAVGKENRRERDIENESCMIAPAEPRRQYGRTAR